MYAGVGLTKRYGGVRALRDVDIAIRPGEVHALLGANGAGKSTLVKLLVGAETADEGELRLDGRPVRFRSVTEAAAAGVGIVFQELSLLPDLDVLSNMFLLREPRRAHVIARRRMEREARPVLERIGLDVPLGVPAGQLSLGEQQLVEIAKSLLQRPRILLLDEPTSALQARETARLMEVIGTLRAGGVGIVYVSHFLEEVLGIADAVTVLRDGATVLDTAPRASVAVPDLVRAMLGEELATGMAAAPAGVDAPPAPARARARAEAHLRIERLNVAGALADVSLDVAPGEIVGLAGLEGAGQAAVFDVLFGVRHAAGGRVRLPDGGGAPRRVSEAVRRGVALIPADRKAAGGLLRQTLWENVSLVSGGALGRLGFVLSRSAMRERAQRRVEALRVRTSSVDATLDELSGGNQQKVVFAKWLEADPTVVLMDDPTRGVDVGAKAEMYEIVRALAREGRILLIRSSELEELAELCDRVVVFWQGRSVAEIDRATLSEHVLLNAVNTGDAAQPSGAGAP
jgi:ABC-type sugar transport system ATPase subunit